MKLLIDMNLSPAWKGFFRDRGWECEHWSGVGRTEATDAEVMSYAADHGYTLLTHDLDFGSILAVTHGRRPSVVQIRVQGVTIEQFGPRVHGVIRGLTSELEQGALVTIEWDRSRLRMLPISGRSHNL